MEKNIIAKDLKGLNDFSENIEMNLINNEDSPKISTNGTKKKNDSFPKMQFGNKIMSVFYKNSCVLKFLTLCLVSVTATLLVIFLFNGAEIKSQMKSESNPSKNPKEDSNLSPEELKEKERINKFADDPESNAKGSYTAQYYASKTQTINLFDRLELYLQKESYAYRYGNDVEIGTEQCRLKNKGENEVTVFFRDELKSTKFMFNSFRNLIKIDLSKLDTSNLKRTDNMFYFCEELESINFGKFDTSQVTTMDHMFFEANSLTSLDLSNFNTCKVQAMSFMFTGLKSIKSLDVSKFDTSEVISMDSMFKDIWLISSLDVSKFDTAKVNNMAFMFAGTKSLSSLDLSNFDTSKVTNMCSMFYDMQTITSLDLSSFDTSKVTNVGGMFCSMKSLTYLDIRNFDFSKVTYYDNIFYNIPDTDKFTLIYNSAKMNHQNITKLITSNQNWKKIDLAEKK